MIIIIATQAQDTVRYGDSRYLFIPRTNILYTAEHDSVTVGCPTYNVNYLLQTHPIYRRASIYGVAITLDVDDRFPTDTVTIPSYVGIFKDSDSGLVCTDTAKNMLHINKFEYIATGNKGAIYDSASGTYVLCFVPGDTMASYVNCYEFYFDSAVVSDVEDGYFYVGMCYDTPYSSRNSTMLKFSLAFDTIPEIHYGWVSITSYATLHEKKSWGGIFPIIVPDTAQAADTSDSTGIGTVCAEPETTVSPNPTDGVVTVRSTSPLRMVEAYDMHGRRLVRQQASGTISKLNLAGLPRGCYILSVTTDTGLARKKFVRR